MKRDHKRNLIQVAATALMNGYVVGFAKGKIFKGPTKNVCVPVLNCYSCPGAFGACPIGSLQSSFSGKKNKVSFYIIGYLMLFGIVLGRTVCGFLCPFGLIQGLLYKIPKLKVKIPKKVDMVLRYIKYIVLTVMVILLPLFLTDQYGMSTTYFCKYICPAGTIEAGIPMLIANPALRTAIGPLFYWKLGVAIFIIVASILIYRPFCKYLCPLGAIYALFNRVSIYQLKVEESQCINCRVCESTCPMQVDVTKNINSMECIRCGKCMDACPTNAIHSSFQVKKKTK